MLQPLWTSRDRYEKLKQMDDARKEVSHRDRAERVWGPGPEAERETHGRVGGGCHDGGRWAEDALSLRRPLPPSRLWPLGSTCRGGQPGFWSLWTGRSGGGRSHTGHRFRGAQAGRHPDQPRAQTAGQSPAARPVGRLDSAGTPPCVRPTEAPPVLLLGTPADPRVPTVAPPSCLCVTGGGHSVSADRAATQRQPQPGSSAKRWEPQSARAKHSAVGWGAAPQGTREPDHVLLTMRAGLRGPATRQGHHAACLPALRDERATQRPGRPRLPLLSPLGWVLARPGRPSAFWGLGVFSRGAHGSRPS
ncbi:hypothetical protein J0S82_019464 [Galemys pyrenaicus]|uniref:Uncharacterized protein n=1 Tax=Galemys pyrenaicus TaxID=202257 RepID=A0A8J6DIB6_GALPY|nr:hypothetical protein J0S82_019464 [Galemys pyrenaicus]